MNEQWKENVRLAPKAYLHGFLLEPTAPNPFALSVIFPVRDKRAAVIIMCLGTGSNLYLQEPGNLF